MTTTNEEAARAREVLQHVDSVWQDERRWFSEDAAIAAMLTFAARTASDPGRRPTLAEAFAAEQLKRHAAPTLEQPAENADGSWRWVPVEATEAMIDAGVIQCDVLDNGAPAIWSAMLSAAPPRDAGGEVDGGEAITAAAKRMVAVQGMDWAELDGGDIGYWESLAATALGGAA